MNHVIEVKQLFGVEEITKRSSMVRKHIKQTRVDTGQIVHNLFFNNRRETTYKHTNSSQRSE